MRTGSTRREFLTTVSGLSAVTTVSPRARAITGERAQAALSLQESTDWPEFGYDPANTGHNPDGRGARSAIGGEWTYQTGNSITAAPVIANGIVYIGSQDGRVYALSHQTGSVLDEWPIDLEHSIETAPAVANGTLYVGDQTGVVHALDAQTGEIEWQFGTGGAIDGPPVVDDQTVYVGSTDGSLYAINAEVGEQAGTERWSRQTAAPIQSGPAVVPVETGDDGPNRMVYTGNDDGELQAFDASTGSFQWGVELSGSIPGSPAVANETLFVGSLGANPQNGFLHAFDPVTGEQGWWFDADGAVVSSPTIADGTVYVGSRSHELYAVDTESGDEQWSIDTGRQITASPVVVDETVYVANEAGSGYAFDTAGTELWEYETGGGISAAPAVANGTVYFASEDARLYALREGGEIQSGANGDGDGDETVFERDEQSEFAFLIVPTSIAAFFAFFGTVVYLIFRSDWAKRFAVDEPPIEELYDDEDEEIPDYDTRSESAVWSAIVDDVISRADTVEKTATDDVIVTAYTDPDTLESPVVAYEIESARSDAARVQIAAPFVDEDRAEAVRADQSLNEGWHFENHQYVFESIVEPGETVKTMIGRQDCPVDQSDRLRRKPDVTVEAVDRAESED